MSAESMLRYGWWSLRGRFWLALIVVVVHAAGVAFVFVRYRDSASHDLEMASADRTNVERTLGGSYSHYLRETWAGGGLGGLLAVLGVALAVGGVAAERREGTADLTLSLPVPRSRWLIAQSSLVVALLVLLASVSAAVVTVGGIAAGVGVAPVDIALAVFLAGLGPAYAVTLAVAATTWTRDALGAAVIAIAVVYLLGGSGDAAAWHPGGLLDVRSWGAGPPWRAMLVATSLTVGFLLIAIRRFNNVNL